MRQAVSDAELDERQIKRVLFHYGTTPEVASEAEYRHYIGQLRQMHARMDRTGGFEAIAMTYAVMLRLQKYEAAALQGEAEEIWQDVDG